MFGSAYVDAVDSFGHTAPDRWAFRNSAGEAITYGELSRRSNALACHIVEAYGLERARPVIVFGHKSPYMLVAIMACAKAGHPYVPIDVVYPADRVEAILEQVGETLVLDASAGAIDWSSLTGARPLAVAGPEELEAICAREPDASRVASLPGLAPSDTAYIIFTSGSTGTPKGVEVSAECVDGFMAWLQDAYRFADEGVRTWFNRAAYSFDLSVTDLVGALSQGDTCFALEEGAEESLGSTFAALAASGMSDWVSTPSFLDQCLADDSFGPDLLPSLRRMLFCGETLRPQTAREAKRRFGGLSVYNCYGPTESTDFVACCEITDDMLATDAALPVGRVMPGVELAILDPETLEPVGEGESGECFICGHTVAKGYFGREDLTAAAFASCPPEVARGRKSYRTGDEMTIGPDGLLYFHGRLDLQIKLHGFRIELGDIEAALCALDEVHVAAVVPIVRDGQVHHLCACVVATDPDLRGIRATKALKRRLSSALPAYMVPTQFKYLDELPLNNNGKVDRRALAVAVGA